MTLHMARRTRARRPTTTAAFTGEGWAVPTWRLVALAFIVFGFGGFLVTQGVPASASNHHAASVTIDGAIDPLAARRVSSGLDTAIEAGASVLIVQLDTPGGLYSSTRDIVEDLLTSPIPIVVYVSPPGARAASAGTFITAAGHVAAMAPGTNIGAASPVGGGGEDLPDTMKSKATQDAAAFMRSIAEERGRNSQTLEQTVLSAISLTATEALGDNVIDLIAQDVTDLLSQLDGKSVSLASGEVTLETRGLAIDSIEATPLEVFIGILANPNIAFLLLSIGCIGILIELMNPGMILPGVAGVIALALAFVAITNLPMNWVGLGLIVLAVLLLYLETQAPGIGVFAVGAGISFIIGAFLLFGGLNPPPIPSPSFRVNLWVIGILSAIIFVSLGFSLRALRQARAVEYEGASRDLVGQVGKTTTELNPSGSVRLSSEMWSAVSDSGENILEGEEVIVSDVEGLTLKVFKASQ